jgi:2',3'-cyclic-nucleotide 2'-phosphodiesterase (5'-nucleotidase family)
MSTHRPECEISNLLADILVDAGKNYHEHPVLGVYNMGGIRASLPKGVINFGNIIDIAPFENKICFASLRGSDLMDLFRQMASNGGEGVSHGVKLVMNKKFQLLSVTLNGKKINPRKIYRITTIDYIVQGNDGLKAFAKSFDKVEPKDSSNDTRFIIADYFRKNESKGIVVDSNIEGRITVVDK